MPQRYRSTLTNYLTLDRVRLGWALRERLRSGYSLTDLKADLLAGIVVALVAIPLGMALAIATGVPPQNGLYTVIIAGAVVSILGGSRFQVTGPTAAFVVVLVPIVERHGLSGLLTAGFLAGLMLIAMGVGRLGRLIQFIPYPVTTGFTTGIAVVIATIQLKDFFGLTFRVSPETYFDRIAALSTAASGWSPTETGIGVLTLSLLIVWPRVNRRIPAPLVALTVSALVAFGFKLDVSTIGSRFHTQIGDVMYHGVPPILPSFHLPWSDAGSPHWLPNFMTLQALLPSAFAIAMLGAIESLLSAVVADGMAQTRHDPDTELIAAGIGNVLCPFFGGIAATGAIARTATNIRYGATSPLSSLFHAVFALFVLLAGSRIVSFIPMASLAALLLMVAYNMAELKHFKHIVTVAPRSDVAVLLLCFSLTVLFDMVIGVTVGVVLAALLFMHRMASLATGQKLIGTHHERSSQAIPPDVLIYEIAGPLFFGATEKAMSAIRDTKLDVKTVILLMENVPAMDMTGLVALESAISRLANGGCQICLVGVRSQPKELLGKSRVFKSVQTFQTLDSALHRIQKTG